MKIKLPSGLTGEVRKLKGEEVNLFTNREAARKGDLFDRILAACWEKTIETGPYPFLSEDEKSVPWGDIVVADRTLALVAIRIATYGTEYIFPVQCSNTNTCGERFEWQIDLVKDLDVYDLPQETIEKIAANENSFDAEIGGHHIVFKIMTGKDEAAAARRITKNRASLLSIGLAGRLLNIDGENMNHVRAEQFVKTMGADEQWAMLREFEKVDGGVEQALEVECPECLTRQEISLPFEDAAFWIPSTRSQRKKAREETRKGQKRKMFAED